MAHINSLTNGIFTSLSYIATAGALTTMDDLPKLVTLFAAAPVTVKNVRDFPEFGTPSNIVNVPVYGSPASVQVSGQADQNTMEFTINYIPSDFVTDFGTIIGNGLLYPFQIALCNRKPTSFKQISTTGGIAGTPTIEVQNTVFNFAGKFESFTVMPSLTDAYTAKITISMATTLLGPSTYVPAI